MRYLVIVLTVLALLALAAMLCSDSPACPAVYYGGGPETVNGVAVCPDCGPSCPALNR